MEEHIQNSVANNQEEKEICEVCNLSEDECTCECVECDCEGDECECEGVISEENINDMDDRLNAVVELLIEKGILSEEEIEKKMESYYSQEHNDETSELH